MDYQKLFNAEISGESIAAWKAQGKKALGLICCHVPVELFYALDIMPVRMRATGTTESPDGDTWMSTFSCSFARGVLQQWITGPYKALDGIVTSDGCMMSARAFDNAEHISKKAKEGKFFFQIGAPRMSGNLELAYYKDELKDLVEALEKFSGNKLTDEKLKAAIAKENEARELIQQVNALRKAESPVISGEDALTIMLAATNFSIDEYIALLKAFLADAENRTPIADKRARLMIIGSALDNPGYLKVIEDKGGLFVADDLCYGSKVFNHVLPVQDADVLGSVADYYLNRIVCPRMLDNRIALQKNIVDTCKEYGVEGVVYQKIQYCECWGGESLYLEPDLKAIGVPMLIVEREEHLANAGQLAIRAEAFIEMIEK
ncbi:MAG: 2-hydroxyacyl-CoA dehydratase family protein [Oscillospiraceae bacterium]|jgi:benzoyl-CoA reductase/2-hydroxyglutaryl-CoA dehydratase subunit BcrC/BadD/HgdB|nr:2-hydroxyacyl-CoA dehydratase family protein [Oscillospiraceae bacterium]